LASTAVLPITGYVQLNDNPSQSSTMFQTASFRLTAKCLSDTHAVATLTNIGSVTLNYETRTSAGTATGTIAAGASTDINNTATNDLLSFAVSNTTPEQIDGQLTMWGTATTGGVDCVFWGNARAG